MKTLLKTGLATLTLAAGVAFSGVASADEYNGPGFSAGSHEAYQISHCTYNPCNIDYRQMPNWPSNPINRRPDVRVYEYPGYYDERNQPPPDEDQYQDEDQSPNDDNY